MMQGGYGDDAGSNAKLLELSGRFRDEATAHIIAGGGKERRQRQDVECGRSLPSPRRDIFVGLRDLLGLNARFHSTQVASFLFKL